MERSFIQNLQNKNRVGVVASPVIQVKEEWVTRNRVESLGEEVPELSSLIEVDFKKKQN